MHRRRRRQRQGRRHDRRRAGDRRRVRRPGRRRRARRPTARPSGRPGSARPKPVPTQRRPAPRRTGAGRWRPVADRPGVLAGRRRRPRRHLRLDPDAVLRRARRRRGRDLPRRQHRVRAAEVLRPCTRSPTCRSPTSTRRCARRCSDGITADSEQRRRATSCATCATSCCRCARADAADADARRRPPTPHVRRATSTDAGHGTPHRGQPGADDRDDAATAARRRRVHGPSRHADARPPTRRAARRRPARCRHDRHP